MPVFHTKTIESILEPVAQQISKLVVLHDDADDGQEMPDLSMPVQVVQKAADNLIKVGYETCETSEDNVLKKELPEALKRVEQACYSLQEAAITLKKDPKSPTGKRTLIEGERGILQGVSAILLTFDESEVRKIIQLCKQVLEYLSITELIEKMDDLVTYVKNLTPVLTKMTREVDAREKELTHQIHRELLCQHLEQVKNLTPSFISAVKIYLLTMNSLAISDSNNQIRLCIVQNKEFLIKRITYEISEIIRILQLTTYDEDEWTSDDLTLLKQKFNNFEVKLKPAFDWLSDENAVCDGVGEKSLRTAIDDAIFLSSKLESSSNEQILDLCSTIKGFVNNLCVLTQDGKRKTSLAKRTANTITAQLNNLHDKLKQILYNAQHSGVTRPAPTIFGKIEQASKWCNNPSFNDNGLGEQAARLIVQEAKNLALAQKDIEIRQDFEKSCYECEFLINHLIELKKGFINKRVDGLTVQQVGKQLLDNLNFLVKKITSTLVQQVADDFLDINHPIRKLADLVTSPSTDKNNLTEKFENSTQQFDNYSTDFLNHTNKLCKTAKQLALSTTQSRNKRTIELINELTKRIAELTPQVVNTAYVVFNFPGNNSCLENFELMQQQWQTNMGHLQRLVDETLDCELFIKTCEKSIIKETYQTQAAVQENNNAAIITNALNIARRSNRIIQVASQEADNSEDRIYVESILYANDLLKQSLPPMIQSAKMLALEPSNKDNYLIWASSNEKLIDSISKVREAVSNDDEISDRSSLQSSSSTALDDSSNSQNNFDLPNLNTLKITEDLNNNNYYVIPRYKAAPVSKPTPLPDLIEENETEFPLPQTNQPILMAAHDLHVNINQWHSADNDMIAVAKRITLLMARLSELVRGENGTKKDLIATAKQLADESIEICRIAKLLAQDCTDKRMRNNLLQVCERIPTIGTQLKILSTVKATMLGSQASKEDEEATEMLIINAQNLNASVKATVQAAKSASIKIKTNSGMKLRWVRKKSLVQTK